MWPASFAGYGRLSITQKRPLTSPWSRNPQEVMIFITAVGIGVLTGSGIALLTLINGRIAAHFAVLAEEQACLALYAHKFEEYMEKVPRYFIFF